MTTATSRPRLDALGSTRGPARLLAMGAGLLLVGTVLGVFYHVTDVVGGTAWLATYVALALALATVLARALSTRHGLAVAGGLLAAGLAGYLLLLPPAYYRLFSVEAVAGDAAAWLRGRSVLLLLEADLWAVSVAPAPVFATWYLTLRRRYGWAAVVGGLALAFFVLTGDAGRTTTVAGAVGVLGLVGFGSLDRYDGTADQAQRLGLLLAAAVVLARAVGVVPGRAGATPSGGGGAGAAGGTLEATLIGGRRLSLGGDVSLSPSVRFTVTADRSAYWHDATFGRYTGRGWVQTGGRSEWSGPLAAPPGPGSTVQQDFEVEAETRAMPAAWKPVLLGSDATSYATVTTEGALRPSRPLQAGESYTVISLVPEWSAAELRSAGTDYPDHVADRFTRLPDSVPARVHERAAAVVEAAGATTPFEEALAIQGWLGRTKEYSLSVRRRGWDAADAFIFQMEAGYCVHFATAMAVMLRTRGVPTRVAVGYAPGEQVAEHRWVVRGFDSHAWVEVYFPGVGWIPFDPTPAGPRTDTRQRRLEEAREAGDPSVETDDTATTTTPAPTPVGAPNATEGVVTPAWTSENGLDRILEDQPGAVPDTVPEPTASTETVPAAVRNAGNGTGDVADIGGAGGGRGDRDRLSLLAAAAGLAIGAHQFGLVERVIEEVRLRWQPTTDSPRRDVARAFDRLEYYLGRHHRPRGPGETPRQYVDALDGLDARGRVRRVAEIYERSLYAGEESREAADEAVRLVDDVVRGAR